PSPIGTADSTKIRSPQTTGDEDPRPGMSTFQRMFFVSLHSVGGFANRETPLAYGPRHCGQNRSAAAAPPALWRAWPAVARSTECDRGPVAESGAARSTAARIGRTR